MIKYLKYLLLFFALLPALCAAHGLETSQSQVVGDYDIEFEYNTIGSILAGDYTLFDVYLLNPNTKEGIDFGSVFIRIEKKDFHKMLMSSGSFDFLFDEKDIYSEDDLIEKF